MSPPGKQLLGVEPELLQQVGVLFGVDLVGQLLLGLIDLVALACCWSISRILSLGIGRGCSFRSALGVR